MKILVSGSHGLVGSALVTSPTNSGHEMIRLVRSETPGKGEISWKPDQDQIAQQQLEGIEAVVHLAGENIAGQRWNAAHKNRIRESRVQGTGLLSRALAELNHPPRVMICASAVGFYGDRGDEELDEESGPGSGFLAEVCRDWEAAADPASEKGIRVVNLRFGMILSATGGALDKMLLPFKLGLGGKVGSGKQYWSWVALDDVTGAIDHAIRHEALAGPVNCVAPHPVTNLEFTKTLGKVLGRPTIIPMPAFAARFALGEMVNELLLPSARVIPLRLQESGYRFQFEDLEPALRHTLGK